MAHAEEEWPNEDRTNYIEIQSGGAEEREINDEIISTFNTSLPLDRRGWGESCYPSVPTYQQETSYYCGPACLQMALYHITGTRYSQSSLASEAGRNSNDGTYVYKMRNVMNSKQSSVLYAYDTISSQNDLQTKIRLSIANEAPVFFHAMTAPLAMYNGVNLGHYLLGHVIYETGSANTVYVTYNDPWYEDYGNGSVYGTHTDTLYNFYRSLTDYGSRYLIYAG